MTFYSHSGDAIHNSSSNAVAIVGFLHAQNCKGSVEPVLMLISLYSPKNTRFSRYEFAFLWQNQQDHYDQLYRFSYGFFQLNKASGCRLATRKSADAGPEGLRRPCSHS